MSIDRCKLCDKTYDTDFVTIEEHLTTCTGISEEFRELLIAVENVYSYLVGVPELSREENELLTELEEVLRKYKDPNYGEKKPF